jgi:hypothetical protein
MGNPCRQNDAEQSKLPDECLDRVKQETAHIYEGHLSSGGNTEVSPLVESKQWPCVAVAGVELTQAHMVGR